MENKSIWNKILEYGHNLSKKHWIIYTLLTFLPTVWFSLVIGYFGKSLKFISNNTTGDKSLTIVGIIATILVVIISLLITGTNNWYASKSELSEIESLHNEKIFYEQINKSVDYICEDKYKRLTQIIIKIKDSQDSAPDIVSNPSNQLKRILEQINECLCVFISQPGSEYKHKDFYITLSYRFSSDDNRWRWLEGTEEKGLSLEDLLDSSSKSTFNYIIQNDRQYYFNNRKEDAKQEDKYLYDSTDIINADNGNDVGSIFCCRFQVKKGNKSYVEAIVSVSTYKKRFCVDYGNKGKVDNVRDNLLLIVKDYFGKRIGIELCLLYLEYLHENV